MEARAGTAAISSSPSFVSSTNSLVTRLLMGKKYNKNANTTLNARSVFGVCVWIFFSIDGTPRKKKATIGRRYRGTLRYNRPRVGEGRPAGTANAGYPSRCLLARNCAVILDFAGSSLPAKPPKKITAETSFEWRDQGTESGTSIWAIITCKLSKASRCCGKKSIRSKHGDRSSLPPCRPTLDSLLAPYPGHASHL